MEREGFVERKGDRRRRPTPFISKYTFVGRRRAARRAEERYNYYVDRLGGRVWSVIVIVFILSIIDSMFTIYFLNRGYYEMNPLMNVALFIGKPVFILLKYVFTVIGILILGMHKNFRYVKLLISLIVVFYILLNSYHIWLWLSLR